MNAAADLKRPGDGGFEHGRDRLNDLLTVSFLMGAIKDVNDALTKAITVIGKSLPLRTAVLLVQTGAHTRIATWSPTSADAADLNEAVRHARAMLRYLARTDPTQVPVEAALAARSFMTLPLAVRTDRVFGVLQLEALSAEMGEPELAFVNAVAGMLAAGFDRFLDLERDRRREQDERLLARQLHAIAETVSTFLATGNWRIASSLLVRSALEQSGSARGFFGVVIEGPTLRILAYEGLDTPGLEEKGHIEFAATGNLFGTIIASGASSVHNELTSREPGDMLPAGHPPLTRFLCVPVKVRDAVIGMIGVADREAAYTESEQRMLERLARLASVYCQSYHVARHQKAMEEGLKDSRTYESVGRLAAAIAHALNNMMTVVLGNTELLVHELTDSDALREGADAIRKAAERAVRLTSDLLAFGQKQMLFPRPVDVCRLLDETAGLLERLAGPGIELQISTAPDCYSILADRTQIERVLVNLVTNAREAMPSGGRVSVHASGVVVDQAHVLLHPVARPGEYIALVVQDSGKGLDEATLARIFDPFFTTKAFGSSSGMGLPVVQGIVGQTGGWIEVESRVGNGTTVSVFLPRGPRALATVSAEVAPRKPKDRGTVLVVDDEPGIVAMAALMLRRAGHTVLEASSGQDAVKLAHEFPGRIDVVISDLIMPEMGGPEVARAIRPARPDVEIIYMSGYPDELLAAKLLPGHPPLLMAKPFSADGIVRLVDRALGLEDGASIPV